MSHHDVEHYYSPEVEVEAQRRVIYYDSHAEQDQHWEHNAADKNHAVNRSNGRSALNRSLPFMVDVDHRAPWMHAKDYTLLLFLAWVPVMVSCVCAQYVADVFLYFAFMAVCYSMLLGLWACMGAKFDWGYFMKRDGKRSSKQCGLAVFTWALVYMAVWGTATLIMYYVKYYMMASHTSPTPNMDGVIWQQSLYWVGVHLMLVWLGYVETCFFNVLYDNACSGHWLMRMWASLCWAACWWCWLNETLAGTNAWFWVSMCFCGAWVFKLINFAFYDCCSMIGALMSKIGAYCGYTLVLMGFYYGFFQWSLLKATFNWDQSNMFMM